MSNDSDNETIETNLISQALPVAKLPSNIDLNIAPTTGEDYLSRVRLEASKSSVVIANKIDLKKFEKNRTPQYFQANSVEETRKEFKAPQNWQCEKSAEFSQLRDRVGREKRIFFKNNPTDKKKLKLPALNAKKEWHTFCFGKASNSKKASTSEEADELIQGHEPNLTILYNMDQSRIVQLFDYNVEWVEASGYSREAFEWLYALMCFIEKPLLPETHSSLRSLARACLKMRSKLDDVNDEKLQELNLFIALIGRYFEQSDLADKDD